MIEHADEFGTVLIAGDTLDAGAGLTADQARREMVRFVGALARRTTVVICSGNHDLTGRDRHGEAVPLWRSAARAVGACVDGDVLLTDDLAISVCGWSSDARAQLERQRRLVGGRRWIWLHHAPAEGSRTAWDGRRDCGDRSLTDAIAALRPDIVISGHAHEAPFARRGDWHDRIGTTLLLNPGQVPGPRPASVLLDLETQLALWSSSIGSALIRESTPLGPGAVVPDGAPAGTA